MRGGEGRKGDGGGNRARMGNEGVLARFLFPSRREEAIWRLTSAAAFDQLTAVSARLCGECRRRTRPGTRVRVTSSHYSHLSIHGGGRETPPSPSASTAPGQEAAPIGAEQLTRSGLRSPAWQRGRIRGLLFIVTVGQKLEPEGTWQRGSDLTLVCTRQRPFIL